VSTSHQTPNRPRWRRATVRKTPASASSPGWARGTMVQRMHGRRAPARPPRLTGSGRLRSAAGLADRGPADQQHQPAAPRCGGHLARTPNSAASTSRGTYFGGDLIGHSRHADRLMHPQQSRIGLSYADPPPGQRPDGLGLLHPAGDDTGTPLRFPLVCRPRPILVQQSRRPIARDGGAPANGRGLHQPHHRQNLADVLGKRPPCSQAPIVESGWPGAAPEHAPISTPAARGGYPGRVCAGSRGEHGEIINWPRTTAHSWRPGG
jgi:hypothetical protein